MNICFLWYFNQAENVFDNWRDGLRAAIEIIGKEHKVDWIIGKRFPEDKYDAIIFWDDSNSEFFQRIDQYHGKKVLCLTTDPQNFDNLRKLDAVYCESDPVYEAVKAQGIRAIKAMGTDSNFFIPDETAPKDIMYFYPATFSPWKLQRNIAYLGDKLTCIGTVQPDGQEDLQACLKAGVHVEQGYFHVDKILKYYQRSQGVVIPAIHGSERTVLEAMSCGITPQVLNPYNVRTLSYIKELNASGLEPREFILKNYSAEKYAKDILRGIID